MITYKPFEDLSQEERDKLLQNFLETFQTFDHDMVVVSAQQVLESKGINNIHALKVGSRRYGEGYIFAEQLKQQMMTLAVKSGYVILSLPVNKEIHSVAVVIDVSRKQCFFIDSLAEFASEAFYKLKSATNPGEVLEGYEITGPAKKVIQQDEGGRESQWSCGIHSAANIVGIITGEINLRTTLGIYARSADEVLQLTAIFYKAYQDGCSKRAESLVPCQLALNEIKTLRLALSALIKTSGGQALIDMETFLRELTATYPIDLSVEDFQYRTSFLAFLSAFKLNNPDNSLLPSLYNEDYRNHLPRSIQDDIDTKSRELFMYLQRQFMHIVPMRSQVDSGSSSASSTSTVSRSSSSQAATSSSQTSIYLRPEFYAGAITEWQNITSEKMRLLLSHGKACISLGKTDVRSITGSTKPLDEDGINRYWRLLESIPEDQYLLKLAVVIKVALDNLAPRDIANAYTELSAYFDKLPLTYTTNMEKIAIPESLGLIRYDLHYRLLALYISANEGLFEEKMVRSAFFRVQQNGLEQLFSQRHARMPEKVFSEYVYISLFTRLFDKNKPALDIIGESSMPCSSHGRGQFFPPASSSQPESGRWADADYADLPPSLQQYIAGRNRTNGGDFSAAEFWFICPEKRELIEEYLQSRQRSYPAP